MIFDLSSIHKPTLNPYEIIEIKTHNLKIYMVDMILFITPSLYRIVFVALCSNLKTILVEVIFHGMCVCVCEVLTKDQDNQLFLLDELRHDCQCQLQKP